MRDRFDTTGFARHGCERRSGQRGRLIRAWAWIAVASVLVGAGSVAAQDVTMMPPPEDMGGSDAGGPPMTSMGGGSYFSQDLGTMVRATFRTQSYGESDRQDGNLDIGTMQVVSWDDSIAFFDGQVTLSDVQGVGFNLGIGYRWLSCLPYSTDAERVTGVSLWGDGTSTEANNFFPQLGVSFESLGDIWDLRANGYVPIGQDVQVGDFVPTGVTGFQDHFISELTRATVDHSFYAAEIELARRLGQQRDAWGFAGAYELANDDEDTTGVRAGVRGYAYPDLLLQIAVSHDDIFETNTTFSLTWFIGRTRTNFHPACGVLDRFREPVMRNDYVALSQSTARGGKPLTDAAGQPFRVTHVDSNAAPGGDGTFEHPLNNLNEIESKSQAKDIVFVHANSEFTGEAATLLAQQRFLGEGNGIEHTIVTQEEGTIPIPESSPGAADAPRPMILAALGDAVTITDRDEVANFTIDGGTRAIVAGANGAGNPNLHDLTIKNTTGNAIVLTPFVRTDSEDSDNDGNVTEQFVEFNVTIRDVTFENIGGIDIAMNAMTGVDVTDPDVTLQETIALTNIDSMNGGDKGVFLANTHEAGTFTLNNYTNTNGVTGATEGRLQFNDISGDITITTAEVMGGTGYALAFANVESTSAVSVTGLDYDGMTGAAGAIRMDTYDGTFTIASSTLKNGTLNGVSILNKSDGTFTFQNTVTMTNLGDRLGVSPNEGIGFEIDGGALNEFTGVVTVSNNIVNDTGAGRSVAVKNISGTGTSVTFSGDITDNGQGLLVNSNTGGTILFAGDVTASTETFNAVTVTDNTGADISFGGPLDITTTSGDAFVATGGGTLTASNNDNKVTTESGRAVQVQGMTISNANVSFADVNRSATGANSAIALDTLTGGQVTIGLVTDNAGDAGTILGSATNDAILVRNSANVTINGLVVDNSGNPLTSGVSVDRSTNPGMIVNLNNLDINNGGTGVSVTGHAITANSLSLTMNELNINGSTAVGLHINDVDVGPIAINNTTIDGNNANPAAQGVLIENSNAVITFDTASIIREFSGTDFEVNGGMGTITMNGDITNSSAINPLDTNGRSVDIHDVQGGAVTFGPQNAIVDNNLGIFIRDNDGGTIDLLGSHDLDTTTHNAVNITGNAAAASISIGQLDINTTTGIGFLATGGGTLSVNGNANKITTANGRGLDIENMTIGAVDFESVNVTASGDNGIFLANNTTGMITVGDAGNTAGQGGTIQATADAGIHVLNSNVTLNGVTVQNAGGAGENAVEIFHDNSQNVTANLNTLNVTNSAAGRNGVDIDGTGNTGTFNANIQNLSLTANGNGLVVDDGVTLTAGGTNNITTTAGVGLSLTNMAIGSAANFNSVTVSAGTGNGVVMTNVTGGQVAITGTGTTGGSGGNLTTVGDAIVLTNVQNVDLRNMQITNASAGDGIDIDHTALATTAMDVTIDGLNLVAASGNGIDVLAAGAGNAFNLRLNNSTLAENVVMTHTSTGAFGLLVDNTSVATTGTTTAFSLAFSGSAQDGDVTIRNGTTLSAANASALAMTLTGTNADVEFELDAAILTNNSAASETANIAVSGGATLNANVVNNSFSNSLAADRFQMSSDGSTSRINLDIDNNTANGNYELITTNKGGPTDFNFGVVDRDTADARNAGTVLFNPIITDFEDIPGPVEPPTVP